MDLISDKNCNTCNKSGYDEFLGDVYMCEEGELIQAITPFPKVIGLDSDCPIWVPRVIKNM